MALWAVARGLASLAVFRLQGVGHGPALSFFYRKPILVDLNFAKSPARQSIIGIELNGFAQECKGARVIPVDFCLRRSVDESSCIRLLGVRCCAEDVARTAAHECEAYEQSPNVKQSHAIPSLPLEQLRVISPGFQGRSSASTAAECCHVRGFRSCPQNMC